MSKLFFWIVALLFLFKSTLGSTPIIGILSQEVSRLIEREHPEQFSSYIAASYVKFIEGAGGRVVPIFIGQPRSYYEDLLSKVNGVLLPGGATYFNQSNGYAEAGMYIYEIAIELNKKQIYMPIWGTCLGFELLINLSANNTEVRTGCSSQSQALPLEFTKNYIDSRLFGKADESVIHIFSTHPVTANFHLYCFTQETFEKYNLNKIWKVLSLNHDWNGIEFISSVEHLEYPFYGVQFHPEKNLYEFVINRNITHDANSTKTSQYFANFFVNEARKNKQAFINKTEEMNKLIYNFNPKYTAPMRSAFVQQYLFPKQRNEASLIISSFITWFMSLSIIICIYNYLI